MSSKFIHQPKRAIRRPKTKEMLPGSTSPSHRICQPMLELGIFPEAKFIKMNTVKVSYRVMPKMGQAINMTKVSTQKELSSGI